VPALDEGIGHGLAEFLLSDQGDAQLPLPPFEK
jgi:hypothetical protein